MKWRYWIMRAWWRIVARLNRKAYLRHAADNPHGDWEAVEELLSLETEEWNQRGAKVNVRVSDIPLPEGEQTHWKGSGQGRPYIPWDTLCKFRKLVEDAEYEKARRRREGRELWVKYFTAIVAAVAAAASVANLYLCSKK
jgi:hypothetical protein